MSLNDLKRINSEQNNREELILKDEMQLSKLGERKNRSVYKDTWGKRRGAFLPSRSFNQLWKERQQNKNTYFNQHK
jgi:hypothetical protein